MTQTPTLQEREIKMAAKAQRIMRAYSDEVWVARARRAVNAGLLALGGYEGPEISDAALRHADRCRRRARFLRELELDRLADDGGPCL